MPSKGVDLNTEGTESTEKSNSRTKRVPRLLRRGGLLRTGIPMGSEERSFDSLRSLRTDFLIGNLVNNNRTPSPCVFHKCCI